MVLYEVGDILILSRSMLCSSLFRGSIVVLIFMVVRALAGSCARKKRQALPDLLNGLNLIETSVMNRVIIAESDTRDSESCLD